MFPFEIIDKVETRKEKNIYITAKKPNRSLSQQSDLHVL